MGCGTGDMLADRQTRSSQYSAALPEAESLRKNNSCKQIVRQRQRQRQDVSGVIKTEKSHLKKFTMAKMTLRSFKVIGNGAI